MNILRSDIVTRAEGMVDHKINALRF